VAIPTNVTGSILRFHEDFIAQYGPLHRLNTKFFHAARKAEVGSTDSNISKTLISWSKQIRQHFNERNIDIHVSGNDNRILLEGLLEESLQAKSIKQADSTIEYFGIEEAG
jgi:hypothetical protein